MDLTSLPSGYKLVAVPLDHGPCWACEHDYEDHWHGGNDEPDMCMPEDGWCECQGYAWDSREEGVPE